MTHLQASEAADDSTLLSELFPKGISLQTVINSADSSLGDTSARLGNIEIYSFVLTGMTGLGIYIHI